MHCSLVPSIHRGAAGSRIARIAVVVTHVAEVGAAGALQDVAAERGHVSELRTGGQLQRVGDDRIIALDIGIRRHIGHSGQSPQFQIAAIQTHRRPGVRQRIDVDENGRPHHVELHQIEEGGSAGERLDRGVRERIIGGRCGGEGLCGGWRVGWPLICEGAHALTLSARRTSPGPPV
jgi:hypothetical protein